MLCRVASRRVAPSRVESTTRHDAPHDARFSFLSFVFLSMRLADGTGRERRKKEEAQRRGKREARRGVRRYFAVDAAGSIAWRAEELVERETTGEGQRGTQIGESLCVRVFLCV